MLVEMHFDTSTQQWVPTELHKEQLVWCPGIVLNGLARQDGEPFDNAVDLLEAADRARTEKLEAILRENKELKQQVKEVNVLDLLKAGCDAEDLVKLKREGVI